MLQESLVFLPEEALFWELLQVINLSVLFYLFFFFAYACFEFTLAQKPTHVFGSEVSI